MRQADVVALLIDAAGDGRDYLSNQEARFVVLDGPTESQPHQRNAYVAVTSDPREYQMIGRSPSPPKRGKGMAMLLSNKIWS
jgi:hypothetical protein